MSTCLPRACFAIVLLAVLACGENSDVSTTPIVAGRGAASAGASGSATAPAGSNPVAGNRAVAGSSGGAGSLAAGAGTGAAAVGGAGSARGGSGGAQAGRDAGSAGAAGVAGSAAGASGPSGGAGGTSGAAATSGSTPSAGCAKNAARPQGGVVMQSDRIYAFPALYDGKTPLPMLLALHAAGNPNTQLQNLTQGSPLETNFLRVFPKSAGSAWVYATDIDKLEAVIEDVLENYCVDTSRMFATGHSSGAQMVVQLLCNGEKRFKAVAPVAASKYCSKFSPVPALYIQGMMDAQRGGGNGMDVVTMFTTSNGCSSSTTPKPDVASCTSTFDHQQVTPGCVTYQGCMVPTLWCSHNDNGYNNTDGRQHGWPCFASQAIADFFMSL